MKIEFSILSFLIVIFSLAAGQINPVDKLIKEGSDFNAQAIYDQALVDFDKAISMNSTNPEAWHGKGYALEGLGCIAYDLGNKSNARAYFNKAKECLQKAIQLNSSYVDAYIDLAHTESMLHDFDQAFELIDKALEISPNNAEAINVRGTIFYAQSDYDYAIKSYREATTINPESSNAWWDLCDVLKDQAGDPTHAEEANAACQNYATTSNAEIGHQE